MSSKKSNKIFYLARSFFNTARQEGFKASLVRFYYFLRFGKGVTSKQDYDRFREMQKVQPVPFENISDILDENIKDRVLDAEIDIIIPVYNGFEYLEKLFQSIERNTLSPYRLIIVDDASPDERVYPFLSSLVKKGKNTEIILLKNEKNIGFVRTVNRAVEEAHNHFILLNTDTEVPRNWVGRLMSPILDHEKIASTTPMTNSGTIFGFPDFLKDNEILGGLSADVIDSYFKKVKVKKLIEVPTGMGFCMGFNKDVVDKIGMFDADTFEKGYGEENDWSQRAIKSGYRNVVAQNVFVYHKHGGSFSDDEKQELISRNLKKLNEKHPGYDRRVQEFIKDDPLKEMRDIVNFVITACEIVDEKVTLIFDHELGGGANEYVEKFVKKKIIKNKMCAVFSYNLAQEKYFIRFYSEEFEAEYELENMFDLEWFLKYCGIGEIIVSQIVSYPHIFDTLDFIKDLKKRYSSKIILLIHDYFCVCPSYTLLNQYGKYCAVPKDLDVCKKCLIENKGQFRLYVDHSDIHSWHKEWSHFLTSVDDITCFSHVSQDIILKAYPEIEISDITVKPHDVDYINRVPRVDQDGMVTIGILGGINYAKGGKIVKEMVKILEGEKRDDIRIVVIGSYIEKIRSSRLIVHGKYSQDEIVDLVEKYHIDIFLIPSVWPETFSYTAEEVMQMGLPLAVFDLGAPAERVRKYQNGVIIEKVDSRSALNKILAYLHKR